MEWWEFFLVMIVVMPIVVMWISCLIDAIARPDLNGWAKAAWMLFILFLPLIGAITYVVMRPPLVMGRNNSLDEVWGSGNDPSGLTYPR